MRATFVALVALLFLSVSSGPAWATFPGENGKIAFSSFRDGNGNYELFAMGSDGSNQTRLTTSSGMDDDPAWSPDGSKIAFASERDGNKEIYVADADGDNPTRLTNHASWDMQPAWSPDGMQIAFVSGRTGNSDIFVMQADGSNAQNRTSTAGEDVSPSWSPDGSKIAFSTNRGGNWQIYVMDAADGNPQTNLTANTSVGDHEPDWSPDGSKLVYWRTNGGDGEVFVMKADGSDQTNLTNDPSYDQSPTWSPDGKKIAFRSLRGSPTARNNIWVMDAADGGGQTNVSNTDGGDLNPSWQPIEPADTEPPTVDSVSPADGTSGVPSSDNVVVTFSEPMDQQAAEAAFSLKDGGGNSIAGSFSWNSAGTELTFDPDAPLGSGSHEAKVSTAAKDPTGNALETEKAWSFTAETTGKLELEKNVEPDSDPGKFDLNIDGGAVEKQDATDGQSTGEQTVPTSGHSVAEAGGTGTDLADYDGSLRCVDQAAGDAPVDSSGGEVAVGEDADVLCTFTNTRKTGGVIRPTLDPQAPPKDAAWGWGANWYGQLGIGSDHERLLPSEIGGLSDANAVAGGVYHSLALKSDGTVRAWGYNYYGQLGDDSTQDRTSPVQVSGLSDVKAVAAGDNHSLALKSDGTVWAWGANSYGQLGDDSTQDRTSPVQVSGLSDVKAIAVGAYHSLALKSDGTVWAWGVNWYGQLGDDSTQVRTSPVQVSGLSDVKAIGAGAYHSLALKSDGTVRAWGVNWYGQLGDDSTRVRTSPVQVSGLSDVKAIGAGAYHSFALKAADGTVRAWGANSYGQLGDDSTQDRTSPVQVSGLSDVDAVAAGDDHSLALKSDGTVWAWGANSYGQLGDDSTQDRTSPVQVSGLSDVKAVAAGRYHSLAVGRASPTQGVESFTRDLPADSTVTTDVEQDGATAEDPLETTITTPVAGTVSVAETPSRDFTGDFSVSGRSVQITAPDATAADPLVIGFRLDASAYPADWAAEWLSVYRNGSWVADCSGAGASPDPCIESRTRLPDGDIEVVVRSSKASDWLIGRAGPAARAGGPYSVAEGSSVKLAGSATGGEAPLAYRWLGAAGEIDDPTAARPTFKGLDDARLTLSLLVTDAANLSGTDNATVTVANRAPIVSGLNVGTIKNRRLDIKAPFVDQGRLDTHTARVRWGDGSESQGQVTEKQGAGTVTAGHQYANKGTYTVRVTVRDDDGGENSVERRIQVR